LIWYRRRVGQLLDRHPQCRSLDLSGDDIERFLTDSGGLGLVNWQLLQALDALRRFGCYTKAGWAQAVDRRRWEALWREDAASPEELDLLQQGRLPEPGQPGVLRTGILRGDTRPSRRKESSDR